MADFLGQPGKKKKKTFAFLKSVPKPKPVPDLDPHDNTKAADEDDDDDLALFKRSKDFFPIVLQEQEQVRVATPPPPKTTTERKYDSDDNDRTPSSTRSSKRRKLSPSPEPNQSWRESTEDLYGATPPRRVSKSPSPPRSATAVDKDTPPYQSPYKTTGARTSQTRDGIDLLQSDLPPTPRRSSSDPKPVREAISVDDYEDPFGPGSPGHSLSPRKDRTPAAIVLDSDEEDKPAEVAPPPEEDEYDYLIQRAREREQAAKAAAAAPPDGDDASAVDEHGRPRKKPVAVVTVNIFIYSRLEEAPPLKPFGVKRGMTQDLDFVRKHFIQWARQQGAFITDELANTVVLTWKGRPLYKTSTGLSLGWDKEQMHAPPRTPGFKANGILLEAWTEERLRQHKEELERQALVDRGEVVEEEEPKAQEDEAPKLRLTLKEKDAKPFRSSVYADFQVKIVIGAYRRTQNVPDDREIRLRYEGEWLDPQRTLAESDVEDMSTIEVYLK